MMLNPWIWLCAGAAVLALCAGSFIAGIRVESNSRDADLLVQERSHYEAFRQRIAAGRVIAQDISEALNRERVDRQVDAQAFRSELRASRASGRPLATCAPATPAAETAMVAVAPTVEGASGEARLRPAEPRFTAEFARLWDSAHGAAGLPAPGDPGRVDVAATRAGTVDAETVLAVHGDDADAWRECRAIARGWQALARKHGWVK